LLHLKDGVIHKSKSMYRETLSMKENTFTLKRIAKGRLNLILGGALCTAVLFHPLEVLSAPFNSGSTGADGALAPTSNIVLTVPPSGIFNFTTVNIPAGVTVTFTPNATNTPITILTIGDVNIEGTISANGRDGTSVDANIVIPKGGSGGPGGFGGGTGGLAPAWNGGIQLAPGQGLGPGGGDIPNCAGSFGSFGSCFFSPNNQRIYGTIALLPLIGGSGGAGGSASGSSSQLCPEGCNGGGGGGGGGAILIASSGRVSINGGVTANGGKGGKGHIPGGPGSGGAIRLIANTIQGSGSIQATGAETLIFGGSFAGSFLEVGGNGRIRLEAITLLFSGPIEPPPTLSTPGIVNISPIPTLKITTIAGFPISSTPGGSLDTPDIIIPSSTSNPLQINLTAANIPVGTITSVTASPQGGRKISTDSTPLIGTDASSTATVSITLPTDRPSLLWAEVTFPISTASSAFPTFVEGEKVEKIRVASALGQGSAVFLITESGKEIPWN
jgi:hypothetical protein